MQTNGVIYLPVVVKGATRVGGNVRRGLPANTTHSPKAGTMLCQRRRRWPNNVPALGERLLFATSWKGTSCCIVCIGLLTKHADWPIRSTARELTAELTARELKNCIKFYIYV